MQSIKVGILGLGTVGAGTALVLQRNAAEIERRLGNKIEVIIASVRDTRAPRDCDCSAIVITQDPHQVVDHPDVDIVVETIGGDTLARELLLRAFANGKHVVTANKALLAIHGQQLFAAADAAGVSILFEASVGGGISIVKAIREGMAANNIELVAGIINGTGNFILTEMRDKGRNFSDVLSEAQALGYAEADPTFDVEGIDAAHKLAILGSIAFGIPLQFEKIFTEGISALNLIDVDYAAEMGYRIKHLGIARRSEDGIEMRVHPTLIPNKRLIANVDGVMNAVLVKGDAVGNTLHYGAGAGAEATASAVVADLVDLSRGLQLTSQQRVAGLGFQTDALADVPIKRRDQFESAYYIRAEVNDVAGVSNA